MLSLSFLTQLGNAKLNATRLLLSRGYEVPEFERALLATKQSPLSVVGTYTELARAHGCSLCEAMSGTYVKTMARAVAAEAEAQAQTREQALLLLTLIFVDNPFDDAKRRARQVSADAVKTALDAARGVVLPCGARAQGVPHVLLVIPTPLTPEAKREIMNLGSAREGGSGVRADAGESARVEVFALADLQIPLLEHVLVPTHRRLSDEEATETLRERRIYPDQLAPLPENDPVAAFLGFREGDVVAIERASSVELCRVTRSH